MTKLYFVRHGRTEWNLQNRFQGKDGDSPLLIEGIEGAKAVGEALKEIPFGQIYASPQKRAHDTALYILEAHQSSPVLSLEDGLKELGFGQIEGQEFKKAEALHPEQFHNLRHQPEKYHPVSFGGETYTALIERTTAVVKKAINQHPNADLLFVAHGVTILATIQTLLGEKLENLRKRGTLSNTSISILTYENEQFSLELWNGTAHLED
ncbi:histidine phosphatase family protein [Isobaculum melis]|uniref:Probable phosphoglycerate mutase n=1 Tax=Isobaculum melis TaxID=142588 RepID=A0A1H9UJJ4_9LACT|nr:histidine phosphatase family protein [Isobaculum melis]SES09203.1 probable phosphoglycerate mutase [Isobaculum melis]